jgi:TolB protein
VAALIRPLSVDPELFRLEMADADGARTTTLLRSKEPILSADWAPDGKSVVYVSFESGRPAIFTQEIATGRREKLTEFEGLNGAPVFSPDGTQLALVLSVGGNPDIYTMDLETRELSQVTRHFGIDTEPAWTPDGEGLVFTSNRGGQPQIYRIGLDSGLIERLTFEGDYNSRVSVDPYSGLLAMVHGGQANFRIAVFDRESERLRVLSPGRMDESPSFAPNSCALPIRRERISLDIMPKDMYVMTTIFEGYCVRITKRHLSA